MSKSTIEINSLITEVYCKTLVTQKLTNETENPIELKIYLFKNENCLFSSFSAKIGDSIIVKSKIIKTEKAAEKYTDSVSSGNAAIFVSDDPNNENRIIINLGNIPPKNELIFISEFIHFTESSSENYEFELFRNLPIFFMNNNALNDNLIIGKVEIKFQNQIEKIEKQILTQNLIITEEKFVDEKNGNNYIIKYNYQNLPKIYLYNYKEYEDYNYIPSSKIYIKLKELKDYLPIIYSQKSLLNTKEKNYIIQYQYKSNIEQELDELYPSIFIYLLDQSGSMDCNNIIVAKEALILFIQSLPAGSYYQIIGFGTNYKKYDPIPKIYNQENIENSIDMVETLSANLGGTNIFDPLEDIYSSYDTYKKLKLPINIFLLTDGEIQNKKETLELIEQNNNKFHIYSIGIGYDFNKDLIKNAGIIGKGSYNFCTDINNLNEVIATEVSNASKSYITNLNINFKFDKLNLYKYKSQIDVVTNNQINNFCYIIEDKQKDKEDKNKIKIQVKYKYYENNKFKDKNETYEILPFELPNGDELSKLIMNNYLENNVNLSEKEEISLGLKYQILSENTSLFAEIELDEKINEKIKKEIIGDKENKIVKKNKRQKKEDNIPLESTEKSSKPGFFSSLGNSIKNIFQSKQKAALRAAIEASEQDIIDQQYKDNKEKDYDYGFECDGYYIGEEKEKSNYYKTEKSNYYKSYSDDYDDSDHPDYSDYKYTTKTKNAKPKNTEKDPLMEIINTQNFVEGFWDINDKTKIIKEKYQKEFDLLKGLKGEKIDDKVAITILIIYYINKEYSKYLKELVMLIKKGKIFIKKKTKKTYENLIGMIGIK